MCKLVRIKTNIDTEIKVADIKLEYVTNILKQAHKCSDIEKIILLGSVLREDCTEQSDIDMVVVSSIARSKLYGKKEFKQFLNGIHDEDGYEQQYDVICVKGMEEIEKNKDKIGFFNDVVNSGRVLYQKKGKVG